jgi:hypothetical protein
VTGDALTELEDMMNQVFARRADQITPISQVPYFHSYPQFLTIFQVILIPNAFESDFE